MIFAIIDYLKYRFNKGIYSKVSITKDNVYLADKNCLPVLESCKPLDILLVHTKNSFLSWLVMYYTGPTIWSHVATFGYNGYIYDATTKGVIKHHISDYFDGNTYIAVRQLEGVSEEKRKEASFFLETNVGCKFNWKGILMLWLKIISGKNDHYRLRYSSDIIIALLFLALLSCRFFVMQVFITVVLLVYISVVVFNKLFYRPLSKSNAMGK
jgi:hypothetical protein